MEVIVLGLISAARPATSQAAVFALLRAPAAARTLAAFVAAGFAASMLIGVLLVSVLGGVGGQLGRSSFAATFDLLAGVAALGFAAGVQRGGLDLHRRERPRGRATTLLAVQLRHPSLKTAAIAGVATHVPGLIYLVVLNSVAAGEPGPATVLAKIALYNLLWFSLPIAALTLVHRSPAAAAAYLDRLTVWARRHQEHLVVALFGALGMYLILKGLAGLT